MRNDKLFSLFAPVLAFGGILSAQQPAVAVAKHVNLPVAFTPVLGYSLDASVPAVHPIFGTARRSQLGDSVAAPPHTSRLYLPPYQQYALVESTSEAPISVWPLLKTINSGQPSESRPVKDSLPHPDLVSFSPRGQSAALYSKESGQLQLLTGMPGEPRAASILSTRQYGDVVKMALSDDASHVVVQFADGRLMYSLEGAKWQPLSAQYSPAAWSFVPSSHDLVIADTAQQTIALYPHVNGALRILSTQAINADQLAFTKDGQQMIAASTDSGLVWKLQLSTGAVSPLTSTGSLQTLTSLRDGWTFLLSASPTLSLVKIPPAMESAALPQ